MSALDNLRSQLYPSWDCLESQWLLSSLFILAVTNWPALFPCTVLPAYIISTLSNNKRLLSILRHYPHSPSITGHNFSPFTWHTNADSGSLGTCGSGLFNRLWLKPNPATSTHSRFTSTSSRSPTYIRTYPSPTFASTTFLFDME